MKAEKLAGARRALLEPLPFGLIQQFEQFTRSIWRVALLQFLEPSAGSDKKPSRQRSIILKWRLSNRGVVGRSASLVEHRVRSMVRISFRYTAAAYLRPVRGRRRRSRSA